MKAVESVGVHVVREAAGAADPGHEHRVFGLQLLIDQEPLGGREHRVVPAPGAPAGARTLVVVETELPIFLDGREQRAA